MLEIRQLTKHYGERQILFDVDFNVKPGEIVALLGKNGAGKTTIMNCIAGIIQPSGGDILFEGRTLLPESPDRARFGILISAVFFDYLNVEQNLQLLLRANGFRDKVDNRRRIDEILELVGLATQKRKKVRSFSFGMKQRLGLAQALMHDADFLMLDEPLVGLDPLGKELFKDALVREAKENNKAVLFSSHDLPDVSDICDRVVMIKQGAVVFDGPYCSDRRIIVQVAEGLSPEARLGDGVEAHGDQLVMARADSFNELIAAGVFDRHPISEVEVHEDALLRMFRD